MSIIVRIWHTGNANSDPYRCRSWNAALRHVRPADRVWIRPGTYATTAFLLIERKLSSAPVSLSPLAR